MPEKLSEERKAALVAGRKRKQEEKKNAPIWRILLQDGTQKKLWGSKVNGVNEVPSGVAYKDGTKVYWVSVREIDLENRLYII